ncbi:hypothetical protein MKW94_002796 [Papaver nudicaule]|uniref:MADS-box domain-containing protein n=1 Tax=Papaver nudicaule TaxID=74823 RepID=A0AA41V5J2_PAPNU|nr:hypothetical protein [Papaver nudicaule]
MITEQPQKEMDSSGKSEMKLMRYQTYGKRIRGLQKKVYEFSTLCNVDACMIIYRPKQGNHRPDTYPEDLGDVIRIVRRYLSVPRAERTKRHVDISKVSGCDVGIEKDNSDDRRDDNNSKADGLEWDDMLDKLSADQILQLMDSVGSKIETIDNKIKLNENPTSGVSDTPLGINTGMQIQPIFVLQPFNHNLANNGSTMVPMGVINGVTADGANVSFPVVMQYQVMAVPQVEETITSRRNMEIIKGR